MMLSTPAYMPDSPPELTGSKSSSTHSSSQFDHDLGLSDVSHFEEIGLGDDDDEPDKTQYILAHTTSYPGHYDRSTNVQKRPISSRGATTGAIPISGQRALTTSPPHASQGQRDLVGSWQRSGYPTLGSGIHGNAAGQTIEHTQLALPPRRSESLQARSPTNLPSPPIFKLDPRGHKTSRSPSPAHSISVRSVSSNHAPSAFLKPKPHLNLSPVVKHVRRTSWQPSKKTAQELEDEYHDSDEDVPDEAVIWNVPMSPRPPQERASSAGPASANTSASTSPERKSPLSQSMANGEFRITPRSSSVRPAGTRRHHQQRPQTSSGSVPTSPTKPGISRGVTIGSFPLDIPTSGLPHQRFSDGRAKSWNAALSDLSEEARILTEALEAHADVEERQQEENVQSGKVPSAAAKKDSAPRPGSEEVVELPPLRKNDVMIDPLPISREKEAVLTRTRPSWLPPKSQKEERKHLKEYQRMMALSREAERKREARHQSAVLHRDEHVSSILRIWDQHVLPNWDRVIREPRTRELWWRGIPPRSRGTVWQRAIGNELSLTPQSYAAALSRAREAEKPVVPPTITYERQSAWFADLRRDASETFPSLRIFHPDGGPLHDSLVEVLMAYSMYRSDVGYIHGTHLIAALLTLNLPSPADVFIALANLLNRPVPLAFIMHDIGAIARTHSLVLATLKTKFPALHTHLTCKLALEPADYLDPVFRTLFAGQLSLDQVARVWDVYVFEGDGLLVRAAVACLGAMESTLLPMTKKEQVLQLIGWEAEGREWGMGGIGEEAFVDRLRAAGKLEK